MITVIVGTNRKDSRTRLIAEYVYGLLIEQANEEVQFLNLEDIPLDTLNVEMYSEASQSKDLSVIQDEYMVPANKFYFIVPEYNGGIPGVLKLFIDALSVRKYKETFHGGKKAALMGISAGRSGNLRGLESMTGFLNYLQIHVLPNKLPVSVIETLLTDDELTNEGTKKAIQSQVEAFLEF